MNSIPCKVSAHGIPLVYKLFFPHVHVTVWGDPTAYIHWLAKTDWLVGCWKMPTTIVLLTRFWIQWWLCPARHLFLPQLTMQRSQALRNLEELEKVAEEALLVAASGLLLVRRQWGFHDVLKWLKMQITLIVVRLPNLCTANGHNYVILHTWQPLPRPLLCLGNIYILRLHN